MSANINCHRVVEVKVSQDSHWIEFEITDSSGSVTEVTAFFSSSKCDDEREQEAREILVSLKEQIDKLLSE